MSVIATAVKHLMAAGVTGDALLAAIEEMEAQVRAELTPTATSTGAARTRRWRERKATERLPDKEWYPLVGRVIARDGGKCAYCGTTEKLGADHVLPLSRGGTNDIANLTACCESCNKSKGGRTVEEWRTGTSPRHGDVTVTESVTPSLSRPLSPQTPLTPTHTHPEYNTRARKGPVPAKPEGVSSQTWADFLALRKQKRADLSQTALAGIEREAVKAGWSLESALAECVARGWQAFKADWVEGKGAGPPGNSGSLVSGFLTTRKSQTA